MGKSAKICKRVRKNSRKNNKDIIKNIDRNNKSISPDEIDEDYGYENDHKIIKKRLKRKNEKRKINKE